jgi:uncharacterized phage-associated protein
MCLHYEPNHEKATQALNFLADKAGGRIDRITALKLIFFADRYHIRKYGRPIIGDEYWAMQLGPVASMTDNISKKAGLLDPQERSYSDKFLGVTDNKYTIFSLSPVDTDVFSDSDIEALAFAWERFHKIKKRVIDVSHAYPEWCKFKERLDNNQSIKRYPMDYSDFFSDADPDNPDLKEMGNIDLFKEVISDDTKEDARDFARERNVIRALWDR